MPFLAPLIVPILIAAKVSALTASLIGAGFSVLLGVLQASKKPPGPQRRADVTSLGIGEQPRKAIFGKQMIAGDFVFAFNYTIDESNDGEAILYRFCDHPMENLEQFVIDQQQYTFTADGAQAAFTFSGKDYLEIYYLDGTQTSVPAAVLAVAGSKWTSLDIMKGCAGAWVLKRASSRVWPSGRPTIQWFVGGARCWDPRGDILYGGTQDLQDETTWLYVENPIVHALNYKLGIYNNGRLMVGRGMRKSGGANNIEDAADAIGDLDRYVAFANACEEDVTLLAGGTEDRYRCGMVVAADEAYIDVMQRFASACAGEIVSRSGRLEIVPGVVTATTFEFTDADLVMGEPVEFQPFRSITERVNTVIPQYLEETQYWNVTSAPARRETAAIPDEGALDLALDCTTMWSNTQAQRCGEIALRKGRLERAVTLTLPPRFANIEVGDCGEWTSARYLGGATVKFYVTRDEDDVSCRKRLTMRETSDDVYAWVAVDDELVPSTELGEGGAPTPSLLLWDDNSTVGWDEGQDTMWDSI